MRIRLRFRLFLPCKKSASIAFWYQNAACRENPTPMPPVGGGLTAELRHKSENAHRRSHLLRGVGHVVPTCAVLQDDRASVQVCATQTPRPPTVRRKKARVSIKSARALQSAETDIYF